jgi:hypothetical protein
MRLEASPPFPRLLVLSRAGELDGEYDTAELQERFLLE